MCINTRIIDISTSISKDNTVNFTSFGIINECFKCYNPVMWLIEKNRFLI